MSTEEQARDGVSLQESLDATTATGEFMMNLLASVSQWERKVIGERTSDALQHLKAQGKRYCHTVYDNPEVIALMHQLRTAGHSYEAIAQHLNHAGSPTALAEPGRPWWSGALSGAPSPSTGGKLRNGSTNHSYDRNKWPSASR